MASEEGKVHEENNQSEKVEFSPTPEKEVLDDLANVEVVENWEEKVELESCPHCSRTFLPDRLKIHLKSCKADKPMKKRVT